MGSNQSLDRMSIKLPLLESTAMGASLFCLFFDWGTLSSREKSTSQQAGRPRTHVRTTFGFGSAMTAEIQFRDPLRPDSRRAGTRARLHNASFF